MLCDICSEKKATVHLTEIVDEQMTELHLCEDCAHKKSQEMEKQFGLADLLAGLAELGGGFKEKEIAGINCSVCNLTYDNFRKIGRLGCSQCYNSFSKYLTPLLKKIHGSVKHFGKHPKGGIVPLKSERLKQPSKAVVSELETLKQKLKSAIEMEEFEEAAKLRDKIRQIENKSKKLS